VVPHTNEKGGNSSFLIINSVYEIQAMPKNDLVINTILQIINEKGNLYEVRGSKVTAILELKPGSQ
jgi:hypothetical protein